MINEGFTQDNMHIAMSHSDLPFIRNIFSTHVKPDASMNGGASGYSLFDRMRDEYTKLNEAILLVANAFQSISKRKEAAELYGVCVCVHVCVSIPSHCVRIWDSQLGLVALCL